MAYEKEREYLSKLPDSPLSSLDEKQLDQALFKAREDLAIYHRRHITPKIVTLQAIYNAESSLSEYEQLRRQGIAAFSTKRGSVSFQASSSGYSAISPEVVEIIGVPPAEVGRLY